MLRHLFATILTALAFTIANGGAFPAEARADDGHNHDGHDHAGHNHAEVVAFRLTKWKEMHFDDARKAEQHFKTVKQLGCEAKMDKHSGHTGVDPRMDDRVPSRLYPAGVLEQTSLNYLRLLLFRCWSIRSQRREARRGRKTRRWSERDCGT